MAQPINLVPNGSFEDTIDFNNGFFAPKHWDMTLGTPDYFSSYFTFPFEDAKTPYNYYGYQKPKNGQAYIGFIVKHNIDPETREYIQIKLQDTLKKDSIYDFSCWINLPDSFHWSCEQKSIGFTFSDTMVQSDFEVLDRLSPIYFSDSIWDPTNKSGWEKINKRIKAAGNEVYIIIGNFFSDNQTSINDIGGGNKWVYNIQSYYFIDQIGLYQYSKIDIVIPPIDTNEVKRMIIPNIYTPNLDGINDVWKISHPDMVSEISVYNRWGELIKELEEPDFIWEGTKQPSGLYFYKIIYKEKQVEKIKTGTITLIR